MPSSIGIGAMTSNYIPIFMWDIIIYLCTNVSVGLGAVAPGYSLIIITWSWIHRQKSFIELCKISMSPIVLDSWTKQYPLRLIMSPGKSWWPSTFYHIIYCTHLAMKSSMWQHSWQFIQQNTPMFYFNIHIFQLHWYSSHFNVVNSGILAYHFIHFS